MKRPARNKAAKPTQGARRTKNPRVDPRHGLVALPEAVGKTVQELVVANSADDNGIDIFFADRTGLSLALKRRSN